MPDTDLAVDAGSPGTSDDTRTGGLKERLKRRDDDQPGGEEHEGPRYFRERNGQLEEVTPTQIAGKRIGQLTAKLSEARLTASSLETANERLQRLLRASNADANALYESSVSGDLDGGKADITRLQGDLKAAIDDGNTEKQATLTVELTQATAKVARAQVEKERIEAAKKRKPPDGEPETDPDARRPALSPKAQAWVTANPWFDAESEEYDETRHDLALIEHGRLLKSGVRVDSDAYFKQLNERLAAKFATLNGGDPDTDADTDKEPDADLGVDPKPRANGRTNDSGFALPASRGAGGNPPAGSRSLIKLNAEQRATARALQQPEPVYALGVMLADGRISDEQYQERYAEYVKAGIVK